MPEEKKPAAPAVADEIVEKPEDGGETPQDPANPEGKKEEGHVEPKSEYQDELDRIEAEKKDMQDRHDAELKAKDDEKKRLMDIKDKALRDEKDKTRSVKDSWKQEALSEMDRRLEIRDARSRAAKMTNDPTAHKVIMHHYENLPDTLRSKNLDPDMAVEENLQTALALANRKRVASMLNEEAMNDARDRRSIDSMGGSSGSSSFQTSPSATTRAASRLASAYAGKDKNLSKKLSDRIGGYTR